MCRPSPLKATEFTTPVPGKNSQEGGGFAVGSPADARYGRASVSSRCSARSASSRCPRVVARNRSCWASTPAGARDATPADDGLRGRGSGSARSGRPWPGTVSLGRTPRR